MKAFEVLFTEAHQRSYQHLSSSPQPLLEINPESVDFILSSNIIAIEKA